MYNTYNKNGFYQRTIKKTELDTLQEHEYLRGVSCFVIQGGDLVMQVRKKKKGDADANFKIDTCTEHVEGDEEMNAAMIRGVGEEFGIDKKTAGDMVHLHTYAVHVPKRKSWKNYILGFYALEIPENYELKPCEKEIEKLFKLPIADAIKMCREYEYFPNDKNMEIVLENLKRFLQNKNIMIQWNHGKKVQKNIQQDKQEFDYNDGAVGNCNGARGLGIDN